MLVRDESLAKDMSKYLIDRIEHTDNIEVLTCTRVVAVQGKRHLESITIVNDKTHEEKTLPATSLFIFIGAESHTSWLNGVVKGDEKGYILTGPDLVHEGQPPKGWPLDREPFFLETSVPGIFARGDEPASSTQLYTPLHRIEYISAYPAGQLILHQASGPSA
jgi:thioredoxin reductase (NADPH)